MSSMFDPKYGSPQSRRKTAGCPSFLAEKCEADNARNEADEAFRNGGIYSIDMDTYKKERAYRQYDSTDGMNFYFDNDD
jgi:hypothetical protein